MYHLRALTMPVFSMSESGFCSPKQNDIWILQLRGQIFKTTS